MLRNALRRSVGIMVKSCHADMAGSPMGRTSSVPVTRNVGVREMLYLGMSGSCFGSYLRGGGAEEEVCEGTYVIMRKH